MARSSEPAINLPPATLALIVLVFAAHVALLLMGDDARWVAYDQFGFVPLRYSGRVPSWIGRLSSPPSHTCSSTATGCIWASISSPSTAFGAGVERRIGAFNTVSLFFMSGALAAGAHYAVYTHSAEPVIGASGAISGLMSAALLALRESGRMGRSPIFVMAALWIAAFTLPDLFSSQLVQGASVAWVAHIGGFVAGLVLYRFFAGRPA